MNFEEVIMLRRSTRAFLNQEVEDDLVYKLLEYGHSAPSSANIQPWEFLVVKRKQMKRKIVNTTFIGNDSKNEIHQEWIMKAPLLIVVIANRKRFNNKYQDETLNSFIYLDIAVCIENILLGAVSHGLSSCFVSGFRKSALSNALELPSSHEPIAILPVGYSHEICFEKQQLDLLSIIHYETF